jgi:hypothetical protein
MNADLVEAIELGKRQLAEHYQRISEARILAERAYQAKQAEAWAPWVQALEKELPAWATEFMPGPPEGPVSNIRQAMVMHLPIGDVLFTGEIVAHCGIRWHEINVRIDDLPWQNAGRDFFVALGMLAQMNEYAESLRLQKEREAALVQGNVAEAKVMADAHRALDPMNRIAAVLERLADAVEDIAAVAVTLDGVLETAAGNMSEVRVWGEEEEGK